jgi:hypothetical protein
LLPFVFPFLHLQDYARTLLTSFIRHPLHTWFAWIPVEGSTECHIYF